MKIMEPTGRRTFAKSLGLLGLFAVGVEGYKQVSERIVYKDDTIASDEIAKKLNSNGNLSFTAKYGEVDTTHLNSPDSLYTGPKYIPGTVQEVSVALKPGPDGKLYVKEGDIWRKV
jgi:hypothetical protein